MDEVRRGRGRPRKTPIDNNKVAGNLFSVVAKKNRKPRSKSNRRLVPVEVGSCKLISPSNVNPCSLSTNESLKIEEKPVDDHMVRLDRSSSDHQVDYLPSLSRIDIPGPIPNLDNLRMNGYRMDVFFDDIPDF
ncbi:hypothetical protein QVD17_22573 [Tagetes erecta]|uniref:Uncharacterized protein n=1 Tax=Tagetes erecta TaxID=13708 RepID=A0AAD8NTN5_TARER|nr:hypothetical protein QVD17_22573 [Tagetes erecta]